MKESIIINGKPFYYEAVDLQWMGGPKITFNQARNILFKAKSLLEEKNIRFWLIYGTLLGAVREHSFISFDYDVDVQTDQFEDLLEAIPFFFENGLKLCRVQEGLVYSFDYDGLYIDIYIKKKAPFGFNLFYDSLNGNIVPKRYTSSFEQIDFLGEKFLVPKSPERLLRFFYGKTWRTPIEGKHGQYDIWPVHLYRVMKKAIFK